MRLLFFGLSFILISSCSTYKEPEFRKATKINIKELNVRNVTLESDLIYFNPNVIGANISAFDIMVNVNNIEIGKLNQNGDVLIEANSEFVIPTSVSFPPKKILKSEGLLKSALQLFSNERALVEYKGHVTLKLGGIEFEIPLNYQEEIELSK